MKPRVFIGSSLKHRDIALGIQANLENRTVPTVWDQDVARPSEFLIESLLRQLTDSDFAVLVFAPDDLVIMRDRQLEITRDNVVFELGLAMGLLGRERTAVILPKNASELRVPTDLSGLVSATYDTERGDENWKAATADASRQIYTAIERSAAQRTCRYLQRYIAREEPSFLIPNSAVPVSFERLYQILLYMFKTEKLTEFRAFDLAFQRWSELRRPDEEQTFNISNEIFSAVGRMFAKERCKKFRRILVVSPEQLRAEPATHILRRFRDQEAQWAKQYPALDVETRVFVYPDRAQVRTRQLIAQLHDFALFDGDEGRFALVEARSGPNDPVDSPAECRVVTTEDTMTHMAESFDELWDDTVAIDDVLVQIGDREHHVDLRRPASKAYERFLAAYPHIDPETALVIEAGYFDLRTPHDADRFVHLDDALALLDSIRTFCGNVRGNIFLEAFLNDLGMANVCQIDACSPDLHAEDSSARKAAIEEVVGELRRRYQRNDISTSELQIFGMKAARNGAVRRIKKGLKSGFAGLQEANTGDLSVEIYAKPQAGERIFLGTRPLDSHEMTLRCSALLAQHYFDLYQFVLAKRPHLNELWVFDFNRLTERESVRVGAAASFVLYPWPARFKLHVVNCIYSADAQSGTVQVLDLPDR